MGENGARPKWGGGAIGMRVKGRIDVIKGLGTSGTPGPEPEGPPLPPGPPLLPPLPSPKVGRYGGGTVKAVNV